MANFMLDPIWTLNSIDVGRDELRVRLRMCLENRDTGVVYGSVYTSTRQNLSGVGNEENFNLNVELQQRAFFALSMYGMANATLEGPVPSADQIVGGNGYYVELMDVDEPVGVPGLGGLGNMGDSEDSESEDGEENVG